MAISINTNVTSLFAKQNFTNNVSSLSESIGRLSSGLRINKSADDPASLSIASRLESQARGLGQAVRNANDAVSIMQIADSSLAGGIDILNSIKTKALLAAQDSQTTDDRMVLQNDINKLILELDYIIKSSSYNNQSLLTGSFSNKEFQVGDVAGQTIRVTIPSSQETKIGHVRIAELSVAASGGRLNMELYNSWSGETLSIKSNTIAYNNSADNGMGWVADAINVYEGDTGISATAVVEVTSSNSVQAGATTASFAINDVTIGAVNVLAGDSNASLTTAINVGTGNHGVTASISSSGHLELSTSDGRPIEITGVGTALTAADADLSTFGHVRIYQQGPFQINLTDLSEGFAVAFTDNMAITGDLATTIDSTLAVGSVLGGGSTLAAGFKAGMIISGGAISGNIVTTTDSTLAAGSVLASGSIIGSNSVLGGTALNKTAVATTGPSILSSGSILLSGSELGSGTYLTNDITTASGIVTAGTTLTSGATLTADANLTMYMLLASGSVIASGSTLAAGSYVGGDFTLDGNLTITAEMSLSSSSTIVDEDGVTVISTGSIIGGATNIAAGDLAVLQEMTIKSGSVLSSSTELATGSTIGGAAVLDGSHTASNDIYLASGSIMEGSSLIKAGTLLTNDIQTINGLLSAGLNTSQDYTTSGTNTVDNPMTLLAGSVLSSGSTLAANSTSETAVALSNESTVRLVDLSVLTRDEAEKAIEIIDAALADMNAIRAEVGAIHNQFSSTADLLGALKSNIIEARSKIMDIDFSEEVANFTRMQLLVQSSSFSFIQANAVPANVLPLIQGGSSAMANQFFSGMTVIDSKVYRPS